MALVSVYTVSNLNINRRFTMKNIVVVKFQEQNQESLESVYTIKSKFFEGLIRLNQSGQVQVEGEAIAFNFSAFLIALETEFFSFCDSNANLMNHGFDFYF